VKKSIRASIKDESVAEDLFQNAFIRFRENLGRLKDPSKLPSWIFRIAHNRCQDHFRSRKKSSFHEEIHDGLVNLQEVRLQRRVEQREMPQCVQEQLSLLPEKLRSVLIFADVMELSHQEIANIFGLFVEDAKERIHRARKKLKVILEKKCTFEMDGRNVLVCEPVEAKKRRES
jgi:RNA polymerase sigma-70 factor (ECF subfamily)